MVHYFVCINSVFNLWWVFAIKEKRRPCTSIFFAICWLFSNRFCTKNGKVVRRRHRRWLKVKNQQIGNNSTWYTLYKKPVVLDNETQTIYVYIGMDDAILSLNINIFRLPLHYQLKYSPMPHIFKLRIFFVACLFPVNEKKQKTIWLTSGSCYHWSSLNWRTQYCVPGYLLWTTIANPYNYLLFIIMFNYV